MELIPFVKCVDTRKKLETVDYAIILANLVERVFCKNQIVKSTQYVNFALNLTKAVLNVINLDWFKTSNAHAAKPIYRMAIDLFIVHISIAYLVLLNYYKALTNA